MDSTVFIDGDKVSAYEAIVWASHKFGNTFKVRHEFPGVTWRFDFNNSSQATLFALKWV